MNKTIYIQQTGSVYFDAVEEGATSKQPDLKDALHQLYGQNFRRIDRYTQLALLGAGKCINGKSLNSKTSLYLATAKGPGENNIAMQQSLIKDKHVPKPIQFINAVSNSVCYYIMKAHALQGQGLLVSRRNHAFEAALTLAINDIRLDICQSALLGMVDEITHPLSHQRARMGLTAHEPLGEGSHWFLLSSNSQGAIGSIVGNERHSNLEQLIDYLKSDGVITKLLNKGSTNVLFDNKINLATRQTIIQALGSDIALHQQSEQLWDGISAGAIGSFLNADREHTRFINISKVHEKSFQTTLVSRCRSDRNQSN